MLNTANKAALYKLLTDYFVEKSADALSSTFVITQGKKTVRGNMPLSTHLEADYRIVTHVLDAIKCGYTSSTVRGNDTDILVILIAFMPTFLQRSPNFQLRYIGGTDGSDTYDVNVICSNLGVERCRGLLFFTPLRAVIISAAFMESEKRNFSIYFLWIKVAMTCSMNSAVLLRQI